MNIENVKKSVCAGIVLYNPDFDRLKNNIEHIIQQVDKVIIVDNGSKNITTVIEYYSTYPSIVFITNSDNKGIAKALNQIMEYAEKCNYEWVYSLDQDSVSECGIIQKYSEYFDDMSIAMISGMIRDRSFQYDTYLGDNIAYIDNCITSGCILRVSAWREVKGYDEDLFIDKVDVDMGWRLREAGWNIIRIPYYAILHEIGNKSHRVRFGNRKPLIYNYSPFRYYYITRNAIICAYKHREFRDTKDLEKSAYHRLFLILLFEDNKFDKIKKGIKGIVDGYKYIRNK